ncbi:pilus assembly FimT family protein [Propionivibrio sp.]|uniref:pilus assembly FimT family protein n=1 Tax=Propionivibrio sp. TaxID=2212460 RepID=UPI003BF09055
MVNRPLLRCSGFTLVELIMVIIMVGILAVVAMPRFASRTTFETRGFVDQTVAMLGYARKVAVASGRNVRVVASSGGNTLTMTMALSRGMSQTCSPSNVVANPSARWNTPSGISFGSAIDTTFHGDGSAATVAPSFSVSGDGTYTIDVESTGYVHCSLATPCE